MVDEQTLTEMVEAVVREVDPERIILFGSQARGDAQPASDVDLMIVEREPFGPGRSRRAELARIRQALSSFHIPKDLLVYSVEEVNRWGGSANHIIGAGLSEGRVLYERS